MIFHTSPATAMDVTQDARSDKNKVLVIGAAGSIGTHLLQELIRNNITPIAALHRSPLPDDIAKHAICEFGFNIREETSIRALFEKHRGAIDSVWNLAAPLSVDTANDPTSAHDITVGGMKRVLDCMLEFGVRKIYFSDSIGSFGLTSPREGATARWLQEHPAQDPGSDYGVQKRQCRELLQEYTDRHGFDSRFIIIPGVLHTQPSWGGGTTEYALDALLAAVKGNPYICPVPPSEPLPMIHISDLVAGMLLLMKAPESAFESCRGVAMAGFSFTPAMLFDEIKKHYPSFSYSFDERSNPSVALFAKTWPDSLSAVEAEECIGFVARMELQSTVQDILESHMKRLRGGGGSASDEVAS